MSRPWAACGLPIMLAAGCATGGQRGEWPILAHPPTKAILQPGSPVPAPDPATASTVSLPQVLAYADRHAPAIRVGRSRLRLGEAELKAASPLLPEDPAISVSAGPRFGAGGTSIDVEVSLQQQIQIAGERGLRIEAAKRFRERVRAQLYQVRWNVHRRVHAAYRVAQVARQRLAAAERLLSFADQLLSIAERREAAGAIAGLQVQVVKGEVAQARQAKIAEENAYRAARLRLAEISGWPADHLPEPSVKLDAPQPPPSIDRLLKRAATDHPALRTQAAAAREAWARARLADREVVPKPTLGMVYSREGEADASATNIVLGTLSLAIPIWQRNQGNRARAHAQVNVARARYRALAQMLRSRVTRAVSAVIAGAKRIAVYGSKVIPTFEKNLKMIQRAFEAGKIDVLQVMVARGRFLEIQRQSLNAYEDYYRAIATLEAVVGTEVWSAAKRRSVKP